MNSISHPLGRLKDEFLAPVDLFICSASFEDRCLSIGQNLASDRIRKAIIARNTRYLRLVSDHFEHLSRLFDGRYVTLDVDSHDPIETTKNIVEIIRSAEGHSVRRVLIDITTFTHETLLILFRVCHDAFDDATLVEFLYNPAEEYSVGDEPRDKWLSKGIREVRSVMGYPGEFVPSRPTHLVVLVGFEDYRALRLVQEIEPSLVSVGYGDSQELDTRPHQITNEMKLEKLRSVVGNVDDFVFSCYDADSTEMTIREVAGKGEYNTILAPMNTKISSLGAGRAAIRDESIQICYAQADIYNYGFYSRASDLYYRFRVDQYPRG